MLQLPLWEPESSWRPPRVADLPSWRGAKRVGFDVETCDPHLKQLGPGPRRDGYMVGFSFALEDGPSHYVPLRHAGGDNVENPDAALRYLRDQARDFQGLLVGANMSYDLDYAAEEGAVFRDVQFFRDVQIADPLINELHDRYSLEVICERLGLPGKDEALLAEAARHYGVDPKGGLWKLPARFAGPYAAEDALRPLQVLRRQERLLDEQNLWEVFDLESRVLPVLVKLRRRGVRVDEERLARVERWSLEQESQALAEVREMTGVAVAVGDVWKAAALAPALEAIGVRVNYTMSRGKTPKRQYSIDKDFLARVDHPVAEKLAWARKVNKLRTTFAASIRTHLVNGRIHCSFNQLRKTKEDHEGGDTRGAAYGRLSSENPNMQQQPARDEFAKMWRAVYLPEEGCQWFANDYSQQEPRWLVHFAELVGMPGAQEAAQRYRDDPDTDNHDMMTELIHGREAIQSWDKARYKKERFDCKQIFLGRCYGMGGYKLCRQLDLPTRWAVYFGYGRPARYFQTRAEAEECARNDGGRAWPAAGEEGQQILDTFDERLPFVRGMARKCSKLAESRGYIRTISGRRCRFPVDAAGRYDWTHKALNRLIQGTSADQMKKAMVEGDAAGHYIQLQVHDEVDGSCETEGKARELAEIMAHAYPSNVPFKIDVELGPSWGESM